MHCWQTIRSHIRLLLQHKHISERRLKKYIVRKRPITQSLTSNMNGYKKKVQGGCNLGNTTAIILNIWLECKTAEVGKLRKLHWILLLIFPSFLVTRTLVEVTAYVKQLTSMSRLSTGYLVVVQVV
jgi:hypothetical protein